MWLVEMAISTNHMPRIEVSRQNTSPGHFRFSWVEICDNNSHLKTNDERISKILTHLFVFYIVHSNIVKKNVLYTHHYIIFFVRLLYSKPGMESYYWPSTDQLSWKAYGIKTSQVWPSCWLWGILIMFGCVLSQLKHSELYILSCEKSLGLRPRPFSQLRM